MTKKERYEARKAAGLCVKCGKNPADGTVKCTECRNKQNAYYRNLTSWRKENNVCIECGTRQAEDGYTMCLVCRMDRREINKRYKTSDAELEHHRIHNKQLYDARKAEHKCVNCGKQMPEKWDKARCPQCRARVNRNQQKSDREKGVLPKDLMGNGMFCAICAKPVEIYGKKLCNRCYTNCCVKAAKMRENRPTDNYFAKAIQAQWRESEARKDKYNECN